jgi:uncharacterized protein (DUF433 family)
LGWGFGDQTPTLVFTPAIALQFLARAIALDRNQVKSIYISHSFILRSGYFIMQLTDYFNFLAPNDIRLKGTRVGIETILYDFIYKSRTPEEIAQTYSSVTLEQVYATILYYLHDRESVSQYLADWLEWGRQMREEQRKNPSPVVQKLMKIKAERTAEQKSLSL